MFTHKRTIPAVALAVGLVGSPTALAAHEVKVLHGKQVVAVFHSAQCVRRKHSFTALVTRKTNSGWGLYVQFDTGTFTGFHTYPLSPGVNADPYVVVHGGPNDVTYSNLNVPPFPSPGAGQIQFENHGKLMGVGYFPAYSVGGGDAVQFTGVLKCHYPKKKH
jgi:hypothetical protein